MQKRDGARELIVSVWGILMENGEDKGNEEKIRKAEKEIIAW